jgi:hypothetical protein
LKTAASTRAIAADLGGSEGKLDCSIAFLPPPAVM